MPSFFRSLVIVAIVSGCHDAPPPARVVTVERPAPAPPAKEPERKPLVEGPTRILALEEGFLTALVRPDTGEMLALRPRAIWRLSSDDPERATVTPLDFRARGMHRSRDGQLVVVREDNALVVMNDLVPGKIIPTMAGDFATLGASDDGTTIVARFRAGSGDFKRDGTTLVIDTQSGSVVAKLVDLGDLSSTRNGKWLVGDDGIYDRLGKRTWERPRRKLVATNGPRKGTVTYFPDPVAFAESDQAIAVSAGTNVVFFDKEKRTTTSASIACRKKTGAAQGNDRRIVVVCPDEVVIADAKTRQVRRVPLPAHAEEPEERSRFGGERLAIFPRGGGGASADDGTFAACNARECWQIDPAKTRATAMTLEDANALALPRIEAMWGGALVIQRKGKPEIVWGADPRRNDGGAAIVATAAGIEVRPNHGSSPADAPVLRFGGTVDAPVRPPACAEEKEPPARDHRCHCDASRCRDIAPREGEEPVALSDHGVLLAARQTHLRRQLDDGTSVETDLPGELVSAALAPDGRVFAVVRAPAPAERSRETTRTHDLAATDLHPVRVLDAVPPYARLSTTDRDLVVTNGDSASFYPLSRTCATCEAPVARVVARATVALYEHDGKLDVAGDASKVPELLVCVNGTTVRRGACP